MAKAYQEFHIILHMKVVLRVMAATAMNKAKKQMFTASLKSKLDGLLKLLMYSNKCHTII